MLSSLFGDLGPARPSAPPDSVQPGAPAEASGAFAATALMESVATEVNERGQMVDRHSHDLVVTGSPAQAIREHFAATRSDLDHATSQIAILDPTGLWASAVIKALSDAGGRPIERLHLRDHATLRTLAMIERTTLVRREQDTLRIYHADVRSPGADNAAIPLALMECSQMATVVIGTLQPQAVEALLQSLQAAAQLPDWRCPHLLFLLPPNAAWMTNQVRAAPWPARLGVHVISESMSGASSVWNAMLGLWNQLKAQAAVSDAATNPALLGLHEYPIKVSDLGPNASSEATGATADASRTDIAAAPHATGELRPDRPPAAVPRPALDLGTARQAMRGMLPLDGMLACAIVDSSSGMVLADEIRDGARLDIELAGAACAQVLRAHRRAARSMGLPEQIDEVMATAGPRHQVMRMLTRHPGLFLIALLDRHRTNLALARFHLMEIERGLV